MYAEYLMRLLEPLGVYDLRESSVSGALICALGEALDEVHGRMRSDLRDAFPQSAGDLSLWERLLPPTAQADPDARRAAIVHLLGRPEVCCSAGEICAALEACGISARLASDGQDRVTVFLAPALVSDPVARMLVRNLVPAHLAISWEADA